MKVAIDAGHSFITAGKRTPKFADGSFMHEFAFNSVVADRLDFLLRNAGIKTYLTFDPKGQTDFGYNKRVDMANKWEADLYVSIHANAIGDGAHFNSSYGILFLAHEGKPDHVEFAQTLIQELEKEYPYKKTLRWIPGSTTQSLCKYSKMPTAIIEHGFMTNERDAKLLLDYDYRMACANALYRGIILYATEKGLLGAGELAGIAGINNQTKNETIKAIEDLYKRGFLNNPQKWIEFNLNLPLPAYVTFLLMDRIARDQGNKIDEIEKLLGGIR